jgi:hypothetical protein
MVALGAPRPAVGAPLCRRRGAGLWDSEPGHRRHPCGTRAPRKAAWCACWDLASLLAVHQPMANDPLLSATSSPHGAVVVHRPRQNGWHERAPLGDREGLRPCRHQRHLDPLGCRWNRRLHVVADRPRPRRRRPAAEFIAGVGVRAARCRRLAADGLDAQAPDWSHVPPGSSQYASRDVLSERGQGGGPGMFPPR